MKRSLPFSTSVTVGAITLFTAVPAFAQEYSYDYGDGDFGALMASMGFLAFCCLVPMLLGLAFTIWMFVDALLRQEHEFPNSTGSSKLMWILILVLSTLLTSFTLGWIAAVAYYFMVFRKIRRGQGGQPPMARPAGYQQPMAPPPVPPQAPPPPPAPPAAPAPPASEEAAPGEPIPPVPPVE